MSFILDALRKAERERERNQVTAAALRLAAAEPRRRSSGTRWLIALALIALALNAALLAWLQPWNAARERPLAAAASPLTAAPPPAPVAANKVAPAPSAATPAAPFKPIATAKPPPSAPSAATPAAPPPPLSLDIHVYSAQPQRRFVLINGRRYQQGDRLAEGPLVERITPDGVLLEHNGRTLRLHAGR